MTLEPTDPQAIPAAVLERPVHGLSLHGTTLGEVLGRDPTLLVFLRHFG